MTYLSITSEQKRITRIFYSFFLFAVIPITPLPQLPYVLIDQSIQCGSFTGPGSAFSYELLKSIHHDNTNKQIPCILISVIGYGSHALVFRHHMDTTIEIWFQISLTMVWISYFFAILKGPGSPPKDYVVSHSRWQKWCNKCKLYKPERTHHCRKCNMCVLKMDHHCPWTNNCVGHENMPHFMRLLLWIFFTTGFAAYHLGKQAVLFYENRQLPIYLVNKTELFAVICLLPLDLFILLAVSFLSIRCVLHITSGRTQIEEWEMERLYSQCHTERFWLKIRNNYKLVHGKELPKLTSWNLSAANFRALEKEEAEQKELAQEESSENIKEESVVPLLFTPDDFIFPYDLGLFRNVYNNLGNPLLWLLPWSGAPGNGIEFETNTDGDQLDLPWPPDGGNVDFTARKLTDEELRRLGDVSIIKKHLDPRSEMKRKAWVNEYGDGLADFGVDLGAEEEKGIKI